MSLNTGASDPSAFGHLPTSWGGSDFGLSEYALGFQHKDGRKDRPIQ
jgi:hypothetical protein